MLESFRQQRALRFSRVLAKISRNSFSGDEESMKHPEWFLRIFSKSSSDTWTTLLGLEFPTTGGAHRPLNFSGSKVPKISAYLYGAVVL